MKDGKEQVLCERGLIDASNLEHSHSPAAKGQPWLVQLAVLAQA